VTVVVAVAWLWLWLGFCCVCGCDSGCCCRCGCGCGCGLSHIMLVSLQVCMCMQLHISYHRYRLNQCTWLCRPTAIEPPASDSRRLMGSHVVATGLNVWSPRPCQLACVWELMLSTPSTHSVTHAIQHHLNHHYMVHSPVVCPTERKPLAMPTTFNSLEQSGDACCLCMCM
jgi:hypothetical protein